MNTLHIMISFYGICIIKTEYAYYLPDFEKDFFPELPQSQKRRRCENHEESHLFLWVHRSSFFYKIAISTRHILRTAL